MSPIEVIVWVWTIAAAIGLPICARGLWDAWLDWEFVLRGHINGRTRAVARQGLLHNLYWTLKMAVSLAIGAGLLWGVPAARFWPLGLLGVLIFAVALSVLDRRTRAYLMKSPSDRRQADIGPPDGVERRQP